MGRFEQFQKDELNVLAVGIALELESLLDSTESNDRDSLLRAAREFPILRRLMDEIGEVFELQLDPQLMGFTQHMLEQQAAQAVDDDPDAA